MIFFQNIFLHINIINELIYFFFITGRFSGSKVLDIGSGATVHNIASASARFSNIVQSDYVLDNVEELRRWHKGNSLLDWSQFLGLVTNIEKNYGYVCC